MGITVSRLRAPLSVGVLALALASLPFWLAGAHPLGYDTGFYRRYVTQPVHSFPNTVVPGLGTDALVPRLLLDTLRALGIPTDAALYGTYLLFVSLIPVLLYYWLRPSLGRRSALIAGALLALSPVGYTAYWYFLYKNALALCLILLAFIAYERRAFWPLVTLELTLTMTHKTSAIVYLVTLGFLYILDRARRREVAVHAVLTGVALGAVFAAADIAVPTSGAQAVAVFMTWRDYVSLSLGLIIAASYGYAGRSRFLLPPALLAFTLASFAFPLLHLPFYERIFVYANVALTALAAAGLGLLVDRVSLATHTHSYRAFIIVCMVAGLHLGNLLTQVRTLAPLMTDESLEIISAAGALVPAGATILTTNSEAPWYQGWTQAHIAAPGMLKDRHSYEAWVTFWEATSTPDRVAFLGTFPQPLYVSTIGSFDDLINTPSPCLTRITDTLLRYDCDQP